MRERGRRDCVRDCRKAALEVVEVDRVVVREDSALEVGIVRSLLWKSALEVVEDAREVVREASLEVREVIGGQEVVRGRGTRARLDMQNGSAVINFLFVCPKVRFFVIT